MNSDAANNPADLGGDGLSTLFPSADYRLQMRFQRGPVRDFFQSWNRPPLLLEQRRHWLRQDPTAYASLLPEGVDLLGELLEQSVEWGIESAPPARSTGDSDLETLIRLGGTLDPDFLLLKAGDDSGFPLMGGCVCFPSSWSLEEKMGQPLDFIHSVVPGLNEQLGQPIAQFLRRMTPGVAWLRENWGLSRSAELNQHPRRGLPKLDPTIQLNEVWLRIEHQALVALPRTGGVLFGIRIAVHGLAEVKLNVKAAAGLGRALETMPEAMAIYKGIAPARAALLALLRD